MSWAQTTSSAFPSRAVLRFERGVIIDATGLAEPTAAASLFVPHGWITRGGVLWGAAFACTNGYNFDWAATSQDGRSGVALLPQMRWEANNYGAGASAPGCQTAPFQSARAYLEWLATQTRAGARVLDYRDRPDLARLAGGPHRTATPLGERRAWTEAGEALIAFEDGGVDMRGAIAAVVSFDAMTTDMSGLYGAAVNAGGAPARMQALSAFAHPAWFAFAPEGRLDLDVSEAIRQSMQPNPEWLSAIADHTLKIARVSIDEARKRSDIVARSADEVARIRNATWQMQQDSADRRARAFSETIRGVSTYADANAPGGAVELSTRYSHAWRLRDGGYALSSDPNFDPWRDLQIEGQKLELAR